MRIMQIYRDFALPGGIPEQMRELANVHAELGHQVVAACSSKAVEVEGIPIDLRLLNYDFRGFGEVYKIIKSYRPDIVHISAPLVPMDSFFGLFAKLICRVPVIVSPRGNLSPLGINVRFGGKPKSKFMTILKRIFISSVVKLLFRTVDAGHAESKYEAEVLRSMGCKQVITVPMGIYKEWLGEPNRKTNNFRTFTYFGRLDEYHKSLDLVLGAAQRLKESGYQFKIRLVGTDVSGSTVSLKKSIELKKLEDVVTVELHTGRMAEVLGDTDFFLGVFRYAGMSRASGGAIAKGVPLIASREGCWGDWVSAGRFGIVSELSVQGLSDALIKALELSKVEYESMSERAYEYAKSLNWSFVAREFAKGYKICTELKGDEGKSHPVLSSRHS
jgi:glycosyltransferase involved in cell wall biosynthesis